MITHPLRDEVSDATRSRSRRMLGDDYALAVLTIPSSAEPAGRQGLITTNPASRLCRRDASCPGMLLHTIQRDSPRPILTFECSRTRRDTRS